jgi:RNA polymerase sigma factor (sigma-70 family)
MQDEDLTLLCRYVDEGQEEAFAQVVRRNMDMVYSAALRRVGGDVHLAKDVAQDVFIALARHAESLARHRRLAGWLYTATRNAAANRVRGEVRRRGREQEAQTMHEISQESDPGAGWSEITGVLDSSLDELKERDRVALLLRFFNQRTFAEIGSALRISEDAARMRVERALGRLRAQLERRGVRSTATLLGATISQHAVNAAPAGFADSVAQSALTIPVAPAVRALDFIASFRPSELAILAAALLVMGGALSLGREVRASSGQEKMGRPALSLAASTAAKKTGRMATSGGVVTGPDKPLARDGRLGGGRRTEMAATYDSLYHALGMTTDQIERFETLLVPTLNSALWVFDHPIDVRARTAGSGTETEAQLKMLLGENGYRHYKEYNRMVPARHAVRQVASAVYLTEPVSRERGEELTALLTAASRSYHDGGEVHLAALDWDSLLASAQALLSPGQLAALDAVRQRALFQEAVRLRVAVQEVP